MLFGEAMKIVIFEAWLFVGICNSPMAVLIRPKGS
jgi:hypothetical protein